MRVIDPTTGYARERVVPGDEERVLQAGHRAHDQCPVHGPDMERSEQNPEWPNQREWSNDFGKKIGKALGKIFKFWSWFASSSLCATV